MSLLLALAFGIGFGYILYRVGALDYGNILGALRLKDMTIPKFMLLSVAVTTTGVFALRSGHVLSLDLISLNTVGTVLGGLIFGVGFALTGYCPGTSIGAMAEGKRDARFVVGGGIVGVLIYTVLQKWITPVLGRYGMGEVSLAGMLPLNPIVTAVLYSLLLALGIWALDAWERTHSASRN